MQLFFLHPWKHNKSQWSDVIIEKILNLLSSILLENKSLASLTTLTTNDVIIKLLASPLTADCRQHSDEYLPAIKNY